MQLQINFDGTIQFELLSDNNIFGNLLNWNWNKPLVRFNLYIKNNVDQKRSTPAEI